MIDGLTYDCSVITVTEELYIHLLGLEDYSIYGSIADDVTRALRLATRYGSWSFDKGKKIGVFEDKDIAYAVYIMLFKILKK